MPTSAGRPVRPLARRTLLAGLPALAAVAALPRTALAAVASQPDPRLAATNGGVYALAQAGDLTVVGGTFTKMGGKERLNVAAVRPSGAVDPTFLVATDGKVDALAVSADGGTVFLGGTFTTVNGAPRANLAAVDAVTGAVRADWVADTSGLDPAVRALAVSGGRLYVGGKFTGIAGTARKRLVALDAATGALVPGFNPRPDRPVNEVAVAPDGTVVYAGGTFTSLGGQPRVAGGAVSAATGAATAFAPVVDGGNCVTIGLSPDGATLYASTENNTVFAFPTAGAGAVAARWAVKLSGNTQAIAATATEVYLGGHFSQYLPTKTKRAYFASLVAADGSLTPWDPRASGGAMGVWALLVEGSHLHAGGVFSFFGTVFQRGYARFTGTP